MEGLFEGGLKEDSALESAHPVTVALVVVACFHFHPPTHPRSSAWAVRGYRAGDSRVGN